jgi:tetratricopeptide (TPR) repeat protein
MRLRVAPLAALNLFLMAAMVAVGLPGIVSTAIRLPSEVTIKALQLGQPVDKNAVDQAATRLQSAANWSNAARADLALAILAQGPSITDRVAGDHAARQLRLYLASAPDDSLAWANLALAETRRGIAAAAVNAYKISIELAPEAVTSLIARCDFGIDIYAALDDDGKKTLARQCQMAMDPSLDGSISYNLMEMLKRKKALALAKVLMAGDPEASRKFEGMAPKP